MQPFCLHLYSVPPTARSSLYCSSHGDAGRRGLFFINRGSSSNYCEGGAATATRSARSCLLYNIQAHVNADALCSQYIESTEISPTLQIQLPAIDCPFQRRCHPQYEAVRDDIDSWTLSLLDPPLGSQDPQYLAYLEGLYPFFHCVIYPSAPSPRRLALCGKFVVWFFLFDDILESHPDPDFAAEIKRCIALSFRRSSPLAELKKQHASEGSSFAPSQRTARGQAVRLVQRFLEVWEEMCNDMTPSFQARVTAGLLNSVVGMWENLGRDKSVSHTHNDTVDSLSASNQNEFGAASSTTGQPTFEEFMEMRVGDGFAKPMLDLMEYTLEIDLQNIAGDLHMKLEAFKRSALWQMLWFNDMISVRKELLNGTWRFSTVGFLLKRRGVDSIGECQESAEQLQEVIMELWGMMKEEERVVAGLLEEIKDGLVGSNPAEHAHVVLFCEEVCHSIAGNMYWTTRTARYNGLHPLPWNTPLSLNMTSPNLDFLSM